MKKWLILLIAVLSSQAYAKSVFWKCADGSLKPVANKATLDGQTYSLYLNFIRSSIEGQAFRPIDDKHQVSLPSNIEQNSYVTLGGKGEWLMNCVGMINGDKVIFNVKRNAFGCPLIPKSCSAKKEPML